MDLNSWKMLIAFTFLYCVALSSLIVTESVSSSKLNQLDLKGYHNVSASETEGSHFFTTSHVPVLWKPSTDHALYTGINHITLTVNLQSPCWVLYFSGIPIPQNFQTSSHNCDHEFEENILSVVKNSCESVETPQLLTPSHHTTSVQRKKRSVFGVITSITSVAAFGLAAYNTFTVHHLASNVKGMQDHFRTEIESLKKDSKLHVKILEEFRAKLDEFANKIHENKEDLKKIYNEQQYELLINKLISTMKTSGLKLATFFSFFNKKELSPEFFKYLFPNIDLCPNLNCTSMDFFSPVSCQVTSNNIMVLHINGYLTDPNSKLFQSDAFKFVHSKLSNNLTGCLFAYKGPQYLLFNEQSKCVNVLSDFKPTKPKEVFFRFNHEECSPDQLLQKNQLSFANFRNNYEIRKCVADGANFFAADLFQLKTTTQHLVVYCFRMLLILPGFKITIECSNAIYYVPQNQQIQLYDPVTDKLDNIHSYSTSIDAKNFFDSDSIITEAINSRLKFPKLDGSNVGDFKKLDTMIDNFKKALADSDQSWTNDISDIISNSLTEILIVLLITSIVIILLMSSYMCRNKFNMKNSTTRERIELK